MQEASNLFWGLWSDFPAFGLALPDEANSPPRYVPPTLHAASAIRGDVRLVAYAGVVAAHADVAARRRRLKYARFKIYPGVCRRDRCLLHETVAREQLAR
eukprot:3613697-Pleurochrysis_carterae.AAC.2